MLLCIKNTAAANGGNRLLNTLVSEAKNQGIKQLFVLTTRTAQWFEERGFKAANIDDLPQQKKELYNYQRNSKVFIKML